MALDLSSLETRSEPTPVAEPTGKPLDIALSNIDEDPNQPRSEFSEEAMVDMVASIKEKGVKTPVSLREHPTDKGRWMLNYGARRYRASVAAGKETIPAFIDHTHDHYDQVIENIQRDDLKPMEFAIFIKSRIDEGETPSYIAKNLGKNKSSITHHMSLIDAPLCIDNVYHEGKSSSPRTIYELRSLHDSFPEEVQEWCESSDEITRKKVTELATDLKNGTYGQEAEIEQEEYIEPEPFEEAVDVTETESKKESNKIKKPLLLLTVDGREAEAVLNRHPTESGRIYIRYEDGTEEEVSTDLCQITALVNNN